MRALGAAWGAAIAAAALGAWILFDASPGLNWGLWTAVAAAGLLLSARLGSRSAVGPLPVLLALACALSGGAAMSADPRAHVWLAQLVIVLLALAMLVAADPAHARRGAGFALVAPPMAAARAVVEAARRLMELAGLLSTRRWRPAVRGVLMALPIVLTFGGLLGGADPILAAVRDEVVDLLQRLDFIPRLVFFSVLLTAALGAYGSSLRSPVAAPAVAAARAPVVRAGGIERLIVLGAVAGLFGTFLLLQLAYLFGNPGAAAGSGLTYAEYARRGFAELTIVTTLCTLLILVLDRCAERDHREGLVRGVAWLLILENGLLLVSAFRRVALYEAAYGFTSARLLAQAYMLVMTAVLAMLAWELDGVVDSRRLGRRAVATGALALVALIWWNHEAWIVHQNINRAVRTGQLDSGYLVWSLSLNAVPAILEAIEAVPSPASDELRQSLWNRYGARVTLRQCRWFEWNLRNAQAARALERAGFVARRRPEAPLRQCVRVEPRWARD